MYAGTAMLHFASDAHNRAFAVGDCGSVEQLHQLGHEALPEHRTGLEQRSQILDELTGERVSDHGHAHGPCSWSVLIAQFTPSG